MVNKTVKRAKSCGASKYSESEIVLKFIQILNIIKYRISFKIINIKYVNIDYH